MNRTQLESHPLFPFADFRENDASFLLLELYWPAALAEVLPEDLLKQIVPLADADQDKEKSGCSPLLLSFWLPRLGRGFRILYNDHDLPDDLPDGYLDDLRANFPDCVESETDQHETPEEEPETPGFDTRLYLYNAIDTRPEGWDFPTAGQIKGPVYEMETLVCIADTDPEVVRGVQMAARMLFLDRAPMDEISAWSVKTQDDYQIKC